MKLFSQLNKKTNDFIQYNEDIQKLIELFISTNYIDDYDKWSIIDENFENKFSIDSSYEIAQHPTYEMWQYSIFERLGESFKITDDLIYLLNGINGILDVKDIVGKKYQANIIVDNNFDIKSNDFQKFLNFYNYYVQSIDDNKIKIEANKPKEINYDDVEYLYHITFDLYWNKIQKDKALIPKDKSINNSYRPNRIYLNTKYDKLQFESFGRFIKRLKPNLELGNIVISKIDINQYNKYLQKMVPNDHIKIFTDPSYNLDSKVFCMEPIPIRYISIVE